MGGNGDDGGRCLDGRICYNQSFQLTIVACCIALVLGLYAGIRDMRKAKGTDAGDADTLRIDSTVAIT